MRTNIDIDDQLLEQAGAAFGTKTKRDTVNEALRRAVRIEGQKGILKLRGKIDWVGDLDEMRRD